MNVLVLNCGSSTVKFQVIATDLERIAQDADQKLAGGLLDRIGSHSLITLAAEGQVPVKKDGPLRDHREALNLAMRWIISPDSNIEAIQSVSDIHAIGHRVVHGGEQLRKSVRIDQEVISKIEDCIELAPLHNPANVKGIRAAKELFGEGIPQVAVFDTAFHSEMPETSYLYGVPYQLYRRHKVRRYGFHGTSHRYVAYRYRQIRKLERDAVKIITLHLGNGCSICAIDGGRSVNTSMGFTPLEGLLMGTRCGDLDVSVVEFLQHKEGMNLQQIMTVLNKESGLLGISGLTSDMRELLEEEAENQDRRASLAINMYCKRVRSYVGRYHVELGGAEALVFTGGVGQNSPEIRSRICEGLECIGLRLDPQRNEKIHSGKAGVITAKGSRLRAYAFPTNEELLIARDTVRVIEDAPRTW